MPEAPALFQTVTTPNPQELAFYQLVADSSMRPDLIPAVGTTYEAWANTFSPPVRITEGWGSYVYTFTEDGPPGYRAFYFGKARTQEERDTPFQEFYTNRNYSWPPVLERLGFVLDYFNPVKSVIASGATIYNPRVYARRNARPGVVTDSTCKVQRFLSEVPWPAGSFQHMQPIPTEVSWQFFSNSDGVGRCLHPDVTIPAFINGGQVAQGAGTPDSSQIGDTAQFFPSTNFTDWSAFVLEDTQQPVKGLWLREKIIIFPPLRPQASKF